MAISFRMENDDDLIRLRSEAKHIDCLYELDQIFRDFSSTSEDVFMKAVRIIPMGFRFPDLCRAEIEVEDARFSEKEPKRTDLKLSEPIRVEGVFVGRVRVEYEGPLRMDKGVFLPSEKKLLRNIADRLGDYLLMAKFRAALGHRFAGLPTEELDENRWAKVREWLEGIGIPSNSIRAILQQPINFHKGEVMNKQGADSSYLYILADGYVKNYIEAGTDRRMIFKIVKPVDWIGTPLISGRNHLFFSSMALTDALVYPIHREDLNRLGDESPQIPALIHNAFAQSVELNLTRIAQLMTCQSMGKIATILQYLSEEVFKSAMIPSALSRKDISELTTMSTESAVRMLSMLKRDNVIRSSSKGIEILDAKMLKLLSQTG